MCELLGKRQIHLRGWDQRRLLDHLHKEIQPPHRKLRVQAGCCSLVFFPLPLHGGIDRLNELHLRVDIDKLLPRIACDIRRLLEHEHFSGIAADKPSLLRRILDRVPIHDAELVDHDRGHEVLPYLVHHPVHKIVVRGLQVLHRLDQPHRVPAFLVKIELHINVVDLVVGVRLPSNQRVPGVRLGYRDDHVLHLVVFHVLVENGNIIPLKLDHRNQPHTLVNLNVRVNLGIRRTVKTIP